MLEQKTYKNVKNIFYFIIIYILSLEELCPVSDLDEERDEGFDQDTLGQGTYLRVYRRELLPIARGELGEYRDYRLLTPEETQREFDRDLPLLLFPK